MNKFFLSLGLLVTFLSFGQSEPNLNARRVLEVPWTLGLGVNIVDNDGGQFSSLFSTDNWNFKNPLILSGEYRFKTYLAGNMTISFNSLSNENLQNGVNLPTNNLLFAMDANAKLYYDQFFLPQYQLNWIEMYVLAGIGFTSVAIDSFNTGTFNAGLGFQVWFNEPRNFGLRLQTAGKWGFTDYIYLKNYIQYSIELLYRF